MLASAMRLDSTVNFPYQMSLGAIADNRMIRSMAGQIALDFRRMGMQVNFAPDMDVNNNSKNTVINFRSFGENKENVSLKGIAFIEGLQAEKVLATAKHFPGHGDTDVDSHMTCLCSILTSTGLTASSYILSEKP